MPWFPVPVPDPGFDVVSFPREQYRFPASTLETRFGRPFSELHRISEAAGRGAPLIGGMREALILKFTHFIAEHADHRWGGPNTVSTKQVTFRWGADYEPRPP